MGYLQNNVPKHTLLIVQLTPWFSPRDELAYIVSPRTHCRQNQPLWQMKYILACNELLAGEHTNLNEQLFISHYNIEH
jgi:hypothetical protein